MTTYWAPYALLPDGLAADVAVEVAAGRFAAVTPGAAPGSADRLPGVLLPGFANGHSHAFHRALRGRTHDAGGTFWTWRDRMYAVAARLDPDSQLALARAAYAEMALAGVTAVGEFHYLHHGPGGRPYADPNAMAEALRQAAADAGVRLTLLDTCYLAGGLDAGGHRPLAGEQLRFGDGDRGGVGRRGWTRCGRRPGCGSAPRSTRSGRCRPRRSRSVAAARPAARCTCTCPSSRRRTTPAGVLRLHPDRAAGPARARSARGPPRCTPPT